MADLDRAYRAATCPMTGCGEQLYVRFDHTVPLMLGNLDDRDAITPDDGDVGSWKVECVLGHVVLVPADPGCPLDHEGADCSCDVDFSEEARTFRASDADRLHVVLDQLTRATASNRSPGGAP